jgi:hypothetical protein
MKKQKLFSVFLVCFLVLSSLSSAYAQNSETDFTVVLTKDGTGAVITKYVGRSAVVRIPATIQGMPVREIGPAAFGNYFSNSFTGYYEENTLITSVVIPEGVTTIGGNAFIKCSKLTSVTLSGTIVNIGGAAFEGCTSLISITLPDGLTTLGGAAFQDCSSLRTVTIPNGITTIGGDTFSGCQSLTSINLPEGLRTIGSNAFSGCTALASIAIPNSVTSIGRGAFGSYRQDEASQPTYLASGITSITWWPTRIATIGIGMFRDCRNLQTVVIPEGVTRISQWAFRECRALTSVTLPSTIQQIDDDAFLNCSSLTTINISNSVQSIRFPTSGMRAKNFAFDGCRSLTLATQATLRKLGYEGF